MLLKVIFKEPKYITVMILMLFLFRYLISVRYYVYSVAVFNILNAVFA